MENVEKKKDIQFIILKQKFGRNSANLLSGKFLSTSMALSSALIKARC
jgi:hypothetical protein